MKKHIIAGNEIYEFEIDPVLAERLKIQGMDQFNEYYSRTPVYFRSPLDIEHPKSGPGFQWDATRTLDLNDLLGMTQVYIDSVFDKIMTATDIWFLLQRKEAWMSNPKHNHPTADALSIAYLNIAEGEAAIEFYNTDGSYDTFYPKNNTLLISKGEVHHRPVENKTAYDRLSLNMQWNTDVSMTEVFDALDGNPSTETKESERRYEICKSCPSFNKKFKLCKECGCFMPLKTKLTIADCPLGKWTVEESNGTN